MGEGLVKRLRNAAKWQEYGMLIPASICLEAADAIEELQALNAEITKRELKLRMNKPRWIPVTERLPKEYTSILFVAGSGQVHVGYYDSEHKSLCDMTGFRYVCTHWMTLPEMPEEES